jgi:hypothetical protein
MNGPIPSRGLQFPARVRGSAFTFIEQLVVISAIALLTAWQLSALQGVGRL